MANVIEITDFTAPELDVYARLSEGQLLNRRSRRRECSLQKVQGLLNEHWMQVVYRYHSCRRTVILKKRQKRSWRGVGRFRLMWHPLMF